MKKIKIRFGEITKKIKILEVGDIVYNPKYNGFHEIRGINEKTLHISECCSFISDAKTTNINKRVKLKYLLKLKPVTTSPTGPIFKIHKFMEYSEAVQAWKCTSKKRDEAHLFYRDKNIIDSWDDRK